MACAIEALGMALPYSSSLPATDPQKLAECRRAGDVIRMCLEKEIKPCDVMTREAFENAMAIVMAVGGSTNAVLHLIAMARAVEVPLTIDDFQRTSDRVPYLADLRPSGKYMQEDLHGVGGTPAVMKLLLDERLITGDCLTITGKTIAENLAGLPALAKGQSIVRPASDPIKSTGHIRIMRGNFCPEGAVAKITGKEGLRFTGTANCFDSEEEMLAALQQGKIKKGDVVVIRYEGPQGGPGMPEMLSPTGSIVGAGKPSWAGRLRSCEPVTGSPSTRKLIRLPSIFQPMRCRGAVPHGKLHRTRLAAARCINTSKVSKAPRKVA
jgi:dihydroxy-acid dehydratase